MKKVHFTENYLLNPHHPVTVFVIGAGGTGSQVITNLARMSMALRALGHPGLHVTVFDPDTVSTANIGRQLFSETELGLNKATALVTRINYFFGYSWSARSKTLSGCPAEGGNGNGQPVHHLHRQCTLPAGPVEVPERSQRKGTCRSPDSPVLDGLRKQPDKGTGACRHTAG